MYFKLTMCSCKCICVIVGEFHLAVTFRLSVGGGDSFVH